MSKYTNRYPIAEWRDKLDEVHDKLGDEVTIVYRLYSRFHGLVKYVGKSDVPKARESQHWNNLGSYNYHKELDIQVVCFDFCKFTGKSRFLEGYKEESRQYHKHGEWRKLKGNYKHPQRDDYTWKCPIKKCKYH